MLYTWKKFWESMIEEGVVEGTSLVFEGNPAVQIPAKILTREMVKKVKSLFGQNIDDDVKMILAEWLKTNGERFASSEEMIVKNVIGCIHYALEEDPGRQGQTSSIIHAEAFVQRGFSNLEKASLFSDREKKEIFVALSYTVEMLLKQLVEKDVPQVIWMIIQETDQLKDTNKEYNEKLLSLVKHVNSWEYYTQQTIRKLQQGIESGRYYQDGGLARSFSYIMGLIPPIGVAEFNSLHYMNQNMSDFLFGRDEEKRELHRFLEMDGKFSFLVVTGPGGIGKSKLVYSFFLDQLKAGADWKCVFINTSILEKLSECNIWDMERNCLLVYDYAGSSADLLHKLFANIVSAEEKLTHKIRIILIERTGTKEKIIKNIETNTEEKITEFPYWYNTVVARGSREYYPDDYLSKYLYKFLNLTELSLNDYAALVCTYSKQVYDYKLSEKQQKSIIQFAERHSQKISRPLFLLAITDIVIHGQDAARWNTEQIMKTICDRDKRIFSEKVNSPFLLRNLYAAFTYATIFGEWNIRCAFRFMNEDVALNIQKALLESPECRTVILDSIGTPESVEEYDRTQIRINPYEPDVLGEYFVLEQVTTTAITLTQWCDLIYQNLDLAVPFLKRCGQDYCESEIIRAFFEIVSNIVQREYYDAEKCDAILDLLFSLLLHNYRRDVARKAIATVARNSDIAYEKFEKIVLANYSFHNSMTLAEYTVYLEDISYFYENIRQSCLLTVKYIELLGYKAHWLYRKSVFLPNRREEYRRRGRKCQTQVHNLYTQRKARQQEVEEEVEEAYIEANCKILSSLYDACCLQDALQTIHEVNKESVTIKHQRAAIKYLDFYNSIIKNRDHLTDADVRSIFDEFTKTFTSWLKYTQRWPLYTLHVASVLPHLIEGLCRIQQEGYAKSFSTQYLEYYAAYKETEEIQNPQRSTWLWSRRFEAGIDRIGKIYPQIFKMVIDGISE